VINISLNLYKIFYVIAQSKSISEASEKLCISQPAVSKSIRKLEDLLGVKLFYRNKMGIDLTNDGIILYEYVDKCYNYLIAGQKMIEDFKQLKRGNISIGAPSHIACFFLTDYIKKFIDIYPNVKIRLISSSTKILTNELYNHKLDFIIDSPPIDVKSDDVIIKKIGELETTFIGCKETIDNKLSVKNINDYYYILPYDNSTAYKTLNKKLNEYGISINSKIEVDTTDVIISSVKAGLGIGYIVEKAVADELKAGLIKKIDTDIELPKLQINLVYMKNYLTSASKEFIKVIMENIK